MRFSPLVERIAGRGAGTWDTLIEARRRQEAGEDIILLMIGDPDQDPPEAVIGATIDLRSPAPRRTVWRSASASAVSGP